MRFHKEGQKQTCTAKKSHLLDIGRLQLPLLSVCSPYASHDYCTLASYDEK